MTDFRAGELRERCQVLRMGVTAVGDRGQREATFTVHDTRWCNFDYLTGNVLERARKVYANATAQVSMRLPTAYTITTKDRIRFKSKDWGIGAVIPSAESHNDLILLLAEVS